MELNINKTFKLGSDLEINRIGFGDMRITGPQIWGMPEDPQNSIDILRKAVELGVNFIDTADQYGPFVSEKLIGEALAPYNDDVVVATKGGLVRFGPWDKINNDASPQHLEEAINGSLRRLKLEQIPLYQLHRIDPKVPIEITYGFLSKVQKEGKIRHIGLSEGSVEDIKIAEKFFNVVSVQNRYSVLNRSHEDVLDYCISENIAFIPWFPIGGGSSETETKLSSIAEKYKISAHQLALAWLLQHANNIILIPGTSNLQHLEKNIEIGNVILNVEDIVTLNNLVNI